MELSKNRAIYSRTQMIMAPSTTDSLTVFGVRMIVTAKEKCVTQMRKGRRKLGVVVLLYSEQYLHE